MSNFTDRLIDFYSNVCPGDYMECHKCPGNYNSREGCQHPNHPSVENKQMVTKAAAVVKFVDCLWNVGKATSMLNARDIYFNPATKLCQECEACRP
jgi:hypothetical protein